MKRTYYHCDECNEPISACYEKRFRFVLCQEELQQTCATTCEDERKQPWLTRDYHFCSVNCLQKFVNTIPNPNA